MEGSWEIRIGGKIFASFPTTKVEERARAEGEGGMGQKGEERGDSQYSAGLGMRDRMNVISDGYRQPIVTFESSRLLIGSDQDRIKTYVDKLMFYL